MTNNSAYEVDRGLWGEFLLRTDSRASGGGSGAERYDLLLSNPLVKRPTYNRGIKKGMTTEATEGLGRHCGGVE